MSKKIHINYEEKVYTPKDFFNFLQEEEYKSQKASDFYYTEGAKGIRRYYTMASDDIHSIPIAKAKINPKLISQILSSAEYHQNKYKDFFENHARFLNDAYEKENCPYLQQGTTLESLGINDRKEWLKWLQKNHPDKGGDTSLCQFVIKEGKRKKY